MELTTNVRSQDEVSYLLDIELPAETVAQVWDAVVREMLPRLSVPGFRPGRVPRPVVERRFAGAIRQDVRARLVDVSFPKAVKTHELNVARWKLVESDEVEYGKPFRYTAAVEIWPRLAEVHWKGLVLKRQRVVVTEEDIDRVLEEFREQQAVLEPLPEDAEVDETTVVDFYYEPPGETPTTSEPRRFRIDLSRESGASSKLAAHLLGHRVGEVVELPADEEDTSQGPEPRPLRRVKIERTYRKVLPALDDEFARSLTDASGLEELRAVLRKNLLEEQQRRAEEALRSAAVDALIQRNEPLHVPPSVVEEEAVRLALGELRRLGVREEAMERVFKERGEELLPVLRPIAERELKAGILLNSVAREAGVEVSDEEVQAVIQAQLERVPEGRSDLKGRVRSRQNRERQRDLLLLEKTIETILRESQIVEE